MCKHLPIIPTELAENVIEATGLARHVDPNALAELLTSAAMRYDLNAQHRFPYADTRDLSRNVGIIARRLLILLGRPLASWALPPEYPDDTDELRARIIADLQRLIARADIGVALFERSAPRGGPDRPDPDRELIGGDLPAIFQYLFGTPRKGERAGARNRFIQSACEALKLETPSVVSLKKHRDRYNEDTRNDSRPPRACQPLNPALVVRSLGPRGKGGFISGKD